MHRYTHLLLEKNHTERNNLRDLILGGQDGLVNVLGIVFGVSAAGGSIQVILAAGLAATFAEAVSMGAVNYTSTLSERDFYFKVSSNEEKEIETVPKEEKAELRTIYKAKGFQGKLLDDVVDQLTKEKKDWRNTMVLEELHLEPIETKDVLRSSIIVGVSTIVGSLIPLLPYFILHSDKSVYVSFVISAIALFSIGFYQAKSYVGNPFKKGLQMLIIGMGAAVVGFVVGKLFSKV
jgi:predicted membrane protein (TIGR00267 family)